LREREESNDAELERNLEIGQESCKVRLKGWRETDKGREEQDVERGRTDGNRDRRTKESG